jgi:site-specific DNA-methyltransferase (adenine-specific)
MGKAKNAGRKKREEGRLMNPTIIKNCTLYNMDCMELLKATPDNFYDLAITDPPYFTGVAKANFYGSKKSKTGINRLCSNSENWDGNIPNEEYFKELIRVSKNQIVWGINYYEFSNVTGRIVWDKQNDSSTFSNCEIASCSLIKHVKIFRYEWNGMLQGDMKNKEIRIHPTQKPVKLYEWLLTNYAKQGDKILETHLGSGSHAIACNNLGYELTACELDKDYFEASLKRIKAAAAQERLFD